MLQRVTDDEAIDEWRRRLCCCVSAEGGHFEHKLRHLHVSIVNLNGLVQRVRLLFIIHIMAAVTEQIHMYMHN